MLIPSIPESIPKINAKSILTNLSLPKVNVLPETIDIIYIITMYIIDITSPINHPFLFIFLTEYIVPYIILKIVIKRYIIEVIFSPTSVKVNTTANNKSIITVNITALNIPCTIKSVFFYST